MNKRGYNKNRFLKRTVAIELAMVLDLQDVYLADGHRKEKNSCVHLFFSTFYILLSSNLALGILKMLISLCFRDVLQPAV